MANTYKVSAFTTPERLGAVADALSGVNAKFTVTPVIEKEIPIITTARPGGGTGTVKHAKANGVTVRKLRPQRRRIAGGAKTIDTGIGKSIMSVFAGGISTATRTQIVRKVHKDGWRSDGDTYIANLVKEGHLVRAAIGIYRLPTTQESLQQLQAQDPSFKG